MGDQALILATAILITLSALGMGYSVRRLRRETRLSARTWLLGAGVPAFATLGYLLLGRPPFHFLVVLVAFAVGLAITALVAAARSRSGQPGIARQTGVTLGIWAVVYVLAAVTAFIPRADSQALMAVLLALSAGLALGTQVSLALGTRQRMAPALAFAPTPAVWVAPPGAPMPQPAAPMPQPAAPMPQPAAPMPASVATLPAAPVASPTGAATPPPVPVAEPIHFTHTGGRFLFGYTASYIGIWDLANRVSAQAQYPRTREGRDSAWSQFATWEPRPVPVMPYPGLPLEPIADGGVSFSHVGQRFAFGHTGAEHSIWDRWAPGPPVARFGVDPQGAARAWQTFMAWEPAAVQL